MNDWNHHLLYTFPQLLQSIQSAAWGWEDLGFIRTPWWIQYQSIQNFTEVIFTTPGRIGTKYNARYTCNWGPVKFRFQGWPEFNSFIHKLVLMKQELKYFPRKDDSENTASLFVIFWLCWKVTSARMGLFSPPLCYLKFIDPQLHF